MRRLRNSSFRLAHLKLCSTFNFFSESTGRAFGVGGLEDRCEYRYRAVTLLQSSHPALPS